MSQFFKGSTMWCDSNNPNIQKACAENILADALSRLNLPNCDEEDIAQVEKIINLVDLQFDPEMEILEFHEMMEAMETVAGEEEPEPVELTSFDLFVQAL